jgi:hypothetical protein
MNGYDVLSGAIFRIDTEDQIKGGVRSRRRLDLSPHRRLAACCEF